MLGIRSSSFLVEKNISYDGSNYKNIHDDFRPWAEGASGDGTGEWIEITFKVWVLGGKEFCFLISNGYVDFSRPDLYYANNRVKEIQVECAEKGISFTTPLKDTPQFQAVRIPEISLDKEEVVTFRFKIKSVFKGSKYDDTCINRIVPFQE